MAKKKVDKTKRKPIKKKEPEVLTGLDQIDFSLIYRIKGKQGLYAPITGANSDNMHACVNILDEEVKCTTNGIHIERLSDFEFTTYAGSDNLGIKEVMQNMLDHVKANKGFDFAKQPEEGVMPIMLPDFDEDLFKGYHSRKVVMWFDTISKKLIQLEDARNAK